jgi:hypothetical protein
VLTKRSRRSFCSLRLAEGSVQVVRPACQACVAAFSGATWSRRFQNHRHRGESLTFIRSSTRARPKLIEVLFISLSPRINLCSNSASVRAIYPRSSPALTTSESIVSSRKCVDWLTTCSTFPPRRTCTHHPSFAFWSFLPISSLTCPFYPSQRVQQHMFVSERQEAVKAESHRG